MLKAEWSGCSPRPEDCVYDTLEGPAKLVATVSRFVETGTLKAATLQ
jgi:hypothetical protein